MRARVSFLLTVVCLLGMSLPVWAKSISASVALTQTVKLANVELKPGQYRLIADESTGQVKVESRHKVVATVKGQWVKLNQASSYTEVLTTDHTVQQINFAGKNKSLKF